MKKLNGREQPERITEKYAFFWNSLYSQWYTRKNLFKDDNGVYYSSAEKYMMCKKAEVFQAHEILFKMLSTDNARMIKKFGREIKNFSDEVWDKHKLDIVIKANYFKFSQNPELLEIMKQHKDLILVEASPEDKIWGIGLHFSNDDVLDKCKWNGENLLGKCLMDVRSKLKI